MAGETNHVLEALGKVNSIEHRKQQALFSLYVCILKTTLKTSSVCRYLQCSSTSGNGCSEDSAHYVAAYGTPCGDGKVSMYICIAIQLNSGRKMDTLS